MRPPCTTNGRSKRGGVFGADTRLATLFRSYSRDVTEAMPVRVRRVPRSVHAEAAAFVGDRLHALGSYPDR
jgi:hypothetical protein